MKPERCLTEITKNASAIGPFLAKTLANLEEWGGLGYPAGGGDGRGGNGSSSTENAAMGALSRDERDRYATDLAALTEALTAAQTAMSKARRIVDESKVIPVDEKTGKPKMAEAEGCYPCAQIKDPATHKDHEHGWQKVYTRRPRPQNPHGPRIPYCSWHAYFINTYEVEPAAAIVQWHLDHPGRENKVPRQLIQDHHPAEWSMAESRRRGAMFGKHNLGLRTSA